MHKDKMIQLWVNKSLLLKHLNMAVTKEVICRCAAWKATNFGSKMMLSNSSLLFRLDIWWHPVFYLKKIAPEQKRKQNSAPPFPSGAFSWLSSHKYVHWNKTKNIFKGRPKTKIPFKESCLTAICGKMLCPWPPIGHCHNLSVDFKMKTSEASTFKKHLRCFRKEDLKSILNSSRNMLLLFLFCCFIHLNKQCLNKN